MAGHDEPLDVYDVACLAGGLDRVVDTALVALVQSGRVRVQAPGELATTSLTRRHPVEAAVLDAVGPAGHRSVDTVRWRVASDERLLEVSRRLRAGGLLGTLGIPTARHSRWRFVPTYAGRHLLRELLADLPEDTVAGGTHAMRVALHGREGLPDQDLRTAIFEQLPHHAAAGSAGRHPALDFADGAPQATRVRAEILKDAHFFSPGG